MPEKKCDSVKKTGENDKNVNAEALTTDNSPDSTEEDNTVTNPEQRTSVYSTASAAARRKLFSDMNEQILKALGMAWWDIDALRDEAGDLSRHDFWYPVPFYVEWKHQYTWSQLADGELLDMFRIDIFEESELFVTFLVNDKSRDFAAILKVPFTFSSLHGIDPILIRQQDESTYYIGRLHEIFRLMNKEWFMPLDYFIEQLTTAAT